MSDSEDDMPLAQRARPAEDSEDDEDDVPLASRQTALKPVANVAAGTNGHLQNGQANGSAPTAGTSKPADTGDHEDSSSDDDVPLAQRQKAIAAQKPTAAQPKKVKPVAMDIDHREGKRKRQEGRTAPSKKTRTSDAAPARKAKAAASQDEEKEVRWDTLRHCGVLFPPEYQRLPDRVKLLYDGQPVDLSVEQEEVAGFWAVMKETDYVKKQTFIDNFWEGFKQVLGKNHVVKSLDKCNFDPIYEYYMAEKEKKKQLTKEEKVLIKEEKDRNEAKYKTAHVDDRIEQVGNFRVEPPGLFRGRGEHPKMGKLKRRIYPRDITINIGASLPEKH